MAYGLVGGLPSLRTPTAQALPARMEATAFRTVLIAPGGWGVATAVQLWPSQCRIPLTPSTAQALEAEGTATLRRLSAEPGLAGLGVAIPAHLVPFQCRARVWDRPPVEVLPTAHAFVAELASTANRGLVVPGCGLATRAHCRPFQCMISEVSFPLVAPTLPTAHALLAEVAVTPNSSSLLPAPPGLGLAPCVQAVPFQCRIRVWSAVPLSKVPTAHASVADTACTLDRSLKSRLGFGLSTCVQLLPSKCRIKASSMPWLSRNPPTAQTSVLEAASMLVMCKWSLGKNGVGWIDQDVPSQCSTRAVRAPVKSWVPAAKTSHADTVVTLVKSFATVADASGCGSSLIQPWQDAAEAPAAGPSQAAVPASKSGAASHLNAWRAAHRVRIMILLSLGSPWRPPVESTGTQTSASKVMRNSPRPVWHILRARLQGP